MYSLFKFFFRLADYSRGLNLFLLVNLCGGKCAGIPKVGKNVVFKYPPHKGIVIGKKCEIGSFIQFDVPPDSQLNIGSGVKLTNSINIAVANSVYIGNNVLIAEGVSIRDSQHNFMDAGVNINQQGLDVGSIIIDNDVWLGKNSIVLLNSHIKTGCVIGANGLVKGKITEEYGVYIGSPAKKVKNRV